MSKSDKSIIWIAAVVLVAAAAIYCGVRIDHSGMVEAGAVLVGVVCGIAAGIPTSFLLLAFLTRREARKESKPSPPRVIIVHEQEQWHVVGDEDLTEPLLEAEWTPPS